MREETVTYKVFKFNELSDEAKKKALEHFYDINVDHDWWEFCYEGFSEQLKEVGIDCKKFYFSLDRDKHIEPVNMRLEDHYKFIHEKVEENVRHSILDIADLYLATGDGYYRTIPVFDTHGYVDPNRCPRLYKTIDSLIDRCNEVLRSMLEDFISTLQKEYDYLTSEEAIIETINCNEYEFLENGEVYR